MKIRYSKKFDKSLDDIYKYIALYNPIAANKQIEKFYNLIMLLKTNPYLGVIGRVENTRELFIPNTKYFLVYEIETDFVYILNIIHTAKNY
ncbi:Type II toxin-antitoxin system RelE/ParE family toxin [Candidatus Hepatincolaceae symbiont of Richtersius coronifer]